MPSGIETDQLDRIERIYGKGIIRLFRDLMEDKTVLRVVLLGKDYERLTVVTDIEERDSGVYIIIDYPGGFKKAIEGITDWRLRFEFTGKDRIPYIFRTEGGQLVEDGIKLKLPDFIERRQRRKSFRLEAPLGTKLVFTREFRTIETNVINISLGGAFVSSEKGKEKKPVVDVDEYLKAIKVFFPSKDEELVVYIKEAMVKRVEKDIYQGLFTYALQFTEMDKKDRDLLQKLIFRFQREYLRKRQLIDT